VKNHLALMLLGNLTSQMHHCLLHRLPFSVSHAIAVVNKDPLCLTFLSYLIWWFVNWSFIFSS
jgi:hypothetical protein